jgi:chromosome segregation ATPase
VTLEELEAQLQQAVLEVTRLQSLHGTTTPELLEAQERLRDLEYKVSSSKDTDEPLVDASGGRMMLCKHARLKCDECGIDHR